MAARDLGMDRVEIRRRNLIARRRVPVPDADREHLRQRQLPGRAREDPRARPTTSTGCAERDKARAEGRHVGIGVVASNERSVFSSTEFWFWFDKPEFTPTSSPESASLQIDPTGQIVVTLHSQSPLGQQPGDRRRRRSSPRSSTSIPASDRRHLRRLAARAPRHRARRLALHGDGLGRGRRRGRRGEGEDQAHRLRQARGERGRPRVPRRRGERHRLAGAAALARPRSRSTAYMFRLDLPPDMDERARRAVDLRPPAHDAPSDDRSDLGIFYPFVGHAWHIARRRGRRRDGQARVPPLRGGPRRRHGRQPEDARRPDHRRHDPGARHGAVRGVPLRRGRPRPQRGRSSTTTCPRRWTCRR